MASPFVVYSKSMKKYVSLKHYIAFLRRQPKHMQHVYAVTFSGTVTLFLAAIILYVDYGFWHEKYQRTEEVKTQDKEFVTESPVQMLGNFFEEASERFKSIEKSGGSFLEGKEIYSRDGESLPQTENSTTTNDVER